MDKESAKKLIRNTFHNFFEKNDFIYFTKNLLNQYDETKAFHARGYVLEAFKKYIKTYERIGTYTDPEGKKIDILIVYLKRESTVDRARTAQRNFIARYLKERGEKDAGLIAFVSPQEEDWRFSFVKMEYKFEKIPKGDVKVKEEFTPARRYSFLVGKNESSHTAQSCFVDILINDIHNLKLNEIEEAFSIEKVTKEFFGKYRELFLGVKDTLDEIVKTDEEIRQEFQEKGVNIVDFSKKLLGQIVFLYFLQKKGWFGVKKGQNWGLGSKHFLRELFEKKHCDYENFFNDVLEPLFYEALRNDRSYDDHYFSYFNCKIPFLNGGLFDPINDYNWAKTDILLPDTLFSNQIKTKEGDIGTGILDIFDRYNFTVKEDEPLEKEVAVDPEMLGKVFENLLEVKGRKSKGTYYTPREIVHYMCQQSLINYLYTEVNSKQKSRTKEEKIQMKLLGTPDPIQQKLIVEKDSNIISKEDIEKLIKYGDTTIENDNHVATKGEETKTYSFKLPENIRKNAEIIDEALKNIRVCDPAVGSGAFLVGMMTEIVKVRNILTNYVIKKEKRTIYKLKKETIQNCLYGVDIDSGAIEICKLRLWLSLIVDEEDINQIKPLPNLDYKIVCGNSLLGVERNLENWKLFAKLEELKPLFFNETNTNKKQDYKLQIDELISKITNGHKEFDFEVYFSEVFHEKEGFDVVIANPPYISFGLRGSDKAKKDWDTYIRKNYPNSAEYKLSTYAIFINKGIQLLRGKGNICYITPDSYLLGRYFSKLRNYILNSTYIKKILMFETDFWKGGVIGRPTITLLQKNQKKRLCEIKLFKNLKEFEKGFCLENSYSQEYFNNNKYKRFRLLFSNRAKRFVEIVEADSISLGNVAKITTGVRSKIGQKKIIANKQVEKSWKKGIISGAQVYPYMVKWEGHYLNINKKLLWTGGWDSNIVKNPKIMIRQTSDSLIAGIDMEGVYHLNNVHSLSILKENISLEYICAVLNSKLMNKFYQLISLEKGRTMAQTDIDVLETLPIKIIETKDQKKIIELVHQIIHNGLLNQILEEIENMICEIYKLPAEMKKYVMENNLY
ncbi:restriction endonuclease [Candidatus Atribacteria bacterium HGW-Atribacteria-1]|nr:MAG: restriction endonuclease [Candidatus Atribacteria bacterium HGW-Atribacteria-1]